MEIRQLVGLSKDPKIYDSFRDKTALKTQTAHDSERLLELKKTKIRNSTLLPQMRPDSKRHCPHDMESSWPEIRLIPCYLSLHLYNGAVL